MNKFSGGFLAGMKSALTSYIADMEIFGTKLGGPMANVVTAVLALVGSIGAFWIGGKIFRKYAKEDIREAVKDGVQQGMGKGPEAVLREEMIPHQEMDLTETEKIKVKASAKVKNIREIKAESPVRAIRRQNLGHLILKNQETPPIDKKIVKLIDEGGEIYLAIVVPA
jgi:hypothetical protein